MLKVDRQFVAGLGSRQDDEAIVASVVSLARSVGAVRIAEGVETLEHYSALRRMGCESGQGYLFGRPGVRSPARRHQRSRRGPATWATAPRTAAHAAVRRPW